LILDWRILPRGEHAGLPLQNGILVLFDWRILPKGEHARAAPLALDFGFVGADLRVCPCVSAPLLLLLPEKSKNAIEIKNTLPPAMQLKPAATIEYIFGIILTRRIRINILSRLNRIQGSRRATIVGRDHRP